MSTRASRPELEGPLPTPKRVISRKSAVRSSVGGGSISGKSAGGQRENPNPIQKELDSQSEYLDSRSSVQQGDHGEEGYSPSQRPHQ